MVLNTSSLEPFDFQQLWAAWETPSSPTIQALCEGLSGLDLEVDKSIMAKQQEMRVEKLAIYKEIISFYTKDTKENRFDDLWKDLHSPAVRDFTLDHRLKRVSEGKEAANKKYKEGNWLGAFYTYAIAWGCLLPYHYEAFGKEDPARNEIAKLECVLFSNLSAMAKTGVERKEMMLNQKLELCGLGIRCAEACLAMDEVLTVGIAVKSYARAQALRTKLNKHEKDSSKMKINDESIRSCKEQEEKLKGVPNDMLLKDVKQDEKV